MIALVFLATVINYLDRQTLSVVAPVLRDEFRMSNETYGRVVAWSAAGMLHALARDALSLGLFRFLLGMGEAGNWPAGVKVVAEWFPPRERALASGIFNSGSAIGALVAPPLVAGIALRWGWPRAFIAVGATGLVWLGAWWLLYYTPAGAQSETPPAPVSPWRLFRTRFVWSFTLSKVFMDPVWYFYIFWFPEYLNRARGFDLAAIGKYAWIPFLAADVGNLVGGWLSGELMRRGVSLNVARKSSVTLFAALMTSAIPAVLAADARVSIGCVALASFGYTGALANMLAFPADVYPKHVVGSVYGLASMGSGFGGMVFAPVTGWVIDRYSYVPVFFAFGLMPLVCAAILWTLLGPIRDRAEELPAARAGPPRTRTSPRTG